MKRFPVHILLVMAVMAFSGLTPAMADDALYQQGVRAYAEGDYERAANIWLIEAYEGSPDAQFNLGVLYIEGKGVEQDREEAVFWFDKAARNGHMEAQYNLGHLYLEDREDVEMVRQGVDWWRQSAESGFPVAQYNFGRALYYGIGVDQDEQGARAWMEKAAAAGDRRSQQFLADRFGIDPPAVATAEKPVETGGQADQDAATASVVSAQTVASELHVLVNAETILAYSRFNNHAPIVGRISLGTLLKVVSIEGDWLQVRVPGGMPGWVRQGDVNISGDTVSVISDDATVYTDPTGSHDDSDIGTLKKGDSGMLLAQQEGWVRMLAAGELSAWIEAKDISQLDASAQEIESEWQSQSARQRRAAMKTTGSAEPVIVDGTKKWEFAPESFNEEIDSVPEQSLPLEVDTALGSEGGEIEGRELDISVTVDEYVNQDRQTTDAIKGVERTPDFENLYSVKRRSAQMTTAPGADNIALFRIAKGTLLDLVELEDGWARVSVPGGLPVWVNADYVELQGERAIVTGNRVRARAAPHTGEDNPILGLLSQGMDLQFIQQVDGWVRVLGPETVTAWIAVEDISRVDSPADLEAAWLAQKAELLTQLRKRQ